MELQSQFNFEAGADERGYTRWLAGKQLAAEQLARRLGLPLGQQVEVWLRDGIRLRGRLLLKDPILLLDEEHSRHLELRVDHVVFVYRDMESCVRLD